MAYVQKTTPPINKVYTFSLRDFSGGMNNRSDQIADNEGAVVINLMFADDTLLETRYGQKYYNETIYDDEVVFIDEFKPYNDINQLVVGTKKTLYIGDKTIALKDIPSGVNHLGKYYFSDGETLRVYANFDDIDNSKDPITNEEYKELIVNQKKFDGMVMIDASKLAVEDAERQKTKAFVDFARDMVNKLSSTENQKAGLITRLDAIVIDTSKDGLSNIYYKSIGTKLSGYNIYDLVSPTDGHAQLNAEHVRGVTVIDYTNKKIYYEPCKNEFEYSYLGANKVPTSIKYIISHDDRLFMSGNKDDDDMVYITDKLNPLYFPVTNPMQLPPNSERISGMHVFDNSLIVGRQNDVYVIRGKSLDPTIGVETFRLVKLNTHTGFASHQAIDVSHNYLIFLGTDGNVYGIQSSTTDYRELSTLILSKSIDLTAYPIEVSKDDYKNATSYFYNDEWYLSVGDKTLVYSYRKMAWVLYTGIYARGFYGKDGIWLWGRPEGRIATWDKENFFDFGEPYQSLWYSKPFDMDDANSFKQFREFFLVAHTFEKEYSDIYVTFEIDYANVRDRVVISNQVSRWGFAKFGDRFINKNINESIPFIIGRRGRNIRIKVTNSYPLDSIVETYSDLENYPAKRNNLLVKVADENNYYLYLDYEWNLIEKEALNQRMKVYQINGDYEMRGKR